MKKGTNFVFLPLLLLLNFFSYESKAAPNASPMVHPQSTSNLLSTIGPRVVVTNWENYMDPQGCILLNEEDRFMLTVYVNVIVGYDDINSFPPLFYSYDFGGYFTGRSNQITNADLVQYNDNGNNTYRATFVHEIPFRPECTDVDVLPPDFPFTITLETLDGPLQSTGTNPTGNYIDYPVATYQGTLFPSHLFFDGNGIPIPPSAEISGDKTVCCANTTTQSRRAPETASPSMQNLETVQFSPNPFQDEIVLSFEDVIDTEVIVELYNTSGERVISQRSTAQLQRDQLIIDTQDLAAGFYYCRVNNGKSYKLIKL